MAENEALEIFREIQALVADKLQVVSYKWLSRNFSVSSNYAKRLLKVFVDKHGNELEVVYTLSGWLKNNPQTYCIKLASGLNLAEAKREFKENCSLQVYSVQACIPKDLALIWSAEFVQAEELFNQPSTTENCLRDNRFCGVSNSYVKRTVDGRSASAVSQLKNDTGTSVKPKTSSILEASYTSVPQREPGAQSSTKNGAQSSSMISSSGKSDRTSLVANKQKATPQAVKDSAPVNPSIKSKGKNDTSSGGDCSLASLWGRASGKSKPSGPAIDTTSGVPNIGTTAEAQIFAQEAADVMSSDDEGDLNYKRDFNGASNRKRRFVMDLSDEDEEEEKVIRLASPDSPSVCPVSDSSLDTRMIMEKMNPSFEDLKEEKLEVKQDKSKVKSSGLSEEDVECGNKNDITGISLQKKVQITIPKAVDDGDKKVNYKTTNASTSPKRRKVLKTRIDERGREVTEVVWEGEAVGDSNTDKSATNSEAGSRPSVASKAQASGKNAPTNQASKAGNKKPAKGGGKDAKQGNILSFFKKV